MHQTFNRIKLNKFIGKSSLFFITLFWAAYPVFAYNCGTLTSELSSGEAPSPLAIVCVIARVLNVFILFVGVVLIIMIAYSAIKLGMSLGDPKGYKGVQSTWQYIAIGAFVVLGFYAIFRIITHALGLTNFADPNALIDRIEGALERLLQAAGITNY